MIKLHLSLPSTVQRRAIDQRSVPCRLLVGREGFRLIFSAPVFDAIGIVHDWDKKRFNTIVPALGGGEYTYDNFAKLTVKLLDGECYEILELDLFSNLTGWISVIDDGDYSDITA